MTQALYEHMNNKTIKKKTGVRPCEMEKEQVHFFSSQKA
jgi:hypothetical protein